MNMLRYEAQEETYLEVQKLVYDVVNRFIKRYYPKNWKLRQQLFDDLLGHANELFLDAYQKFVPDRCEEFSKWCSYRIRMGLLESLRKVITRNARLQQTDAFLEEIPNAPQLDFDRDELLGNLTEDARIVVLLVLDSPADVVYSVKSLGGPTATNVRKAVREFLRDIGWSQNRITKSFQEVKHAL